MFSKWRTGLCIYVWVAGGCVDKALNSDHVSVSMYCEFSQLSLLSMTIAMDFALAKNGQHHLAWHRLIQR